MTASPGLARLAATQAVNSETETQTERWNDGTMKSFHVPSFHVSINDFPRRAENSFQTITATYAKPSSPDSMTG